MKSTTSDIKQTAGDRLRGEFSEAYRLLREARSALANGSSHRDRHAAWRKIDSFIERIDTDEPPNRPSVRGSGWEIDRNERYHGFFRDEGQ